VNSGTVKVDVGVSTRGYSQTAGSTVGRGTLYGDATISGGSIGGGLDVIGDLTLGCGRNHQGEARRFGVADPITATGALSVAGTLEVDEASGAPYSHTSPVLSSLAVRSGTFESVTSDQADRNYTAVYDDSSVSVTSRPSQVLSSVAGGPVVHGCDEPDVDAGCEGLSGVTDVRFGRAGVAIVPGSLQYAGGSPGRFGSRQPRRCAQGPISVRCGDGPQ
jgi:hypothetical protein